MTKFHLKICIQVGATISLDIKFVLRFDNSDISKY